MNLSQRQLRMFTVLAAEQRFSKASEQLHISQPALSRAIQELEAQLGVALFHRTTRQLSLTEEGERFLPMALRLLSDMQSIAEDLKSQARGMRGSVAVAVGTAFGSALLPSIVREFQATHPQVQVRVLDDNSAGITAKVMRSQVDLGIGSPLGDTSSLRCEALLSAPIGLLAHAEHFPITAQTPLSETLSLPLLREPDDTSILSALRSHGSDLVASMQRGIEVSSLALQLAMVREGLGVAVVSALGASHALAHDLRFVPLQPAIEREIFLMTQRARILSSPAQAFARCVLQHLRSANAPVHGLHRLVRLRPA